MNFIAKVSDEAKEAYIDLHIRKQYKWISFKIENNLIVVNQTLDAPAEGVQLEDRECFEKLKSTLSSDQPLYIVYNLVGKLKDSNDITRRSVFIYW